MCSNADPSYAIIAFSTFSSSADSFLITFFASCLIIVEVEEPSLAFGLTLF